MLQQAMHLFHRKLHSEKLIQKTKRSRRSTTIPSHPRLNMINLIIYLINDFMIRFETIKLFKVIRRKNIHTKNSFQQLINRFNRYLHNFNQISTVSYVYILKTINLSFLTLKHIKNNKVY